MKILMTADAIGGVWSYALALAKALPQHQFLLATLGPRPSESQRHLACSLPNVQLAQSDWRLEWMEGGASDAHAAGEWLLQLEAQFQPDVVHLNGYCHAVQPFGVPVIVVAHSCVLSWWLQVKGEAAPPDWDLYRDHTAAGLRAASCVVSPTRALLTAMGSIYGGMAPTRVIANGITARPDSPRENREPVVLAAGRLWDEAKNIGLLEKVGPLPGWCIQVAGQQGFGGVDYDAKNLDFLGALEPEALFRRMDRSAIWAHPALYEPFGLATLEAARSGCALVLSDIETHRELWDGAALFATPHDPGVWHDALHRLTGDASLRRNLSEKARCRARCFGLEKFGAAYDALYRELS